MGDRLLRVKGLNDEYELKILDAFEKDEGLSFVLNCKEMINDSKR